MHHLSRVDRPSCIENGYGNKESMCLIDKYDYIVVDVVPLDPRDTNSVEFVQITILLFLLLVIELVIFLVMYKNL